MSPKPLRILNCDTWEVQTFTCDLIAIHFNWAITPEPRVWKAACGQDLGS
jgi:hypothetical protein